MAERTSLLSLPEECVTAVLTKLSDQDFADISRVKAVCKSFNRIFGSTLFLKGVAIFGNHMPGGFTDGILEYREAFVNAENPDAMFWKGNAFFMYSYHNEPKEGVELIKKAAKGGSLFGKYAYEIIRKRLWDDERDATDVCELPRGVARQIQRKIVEVEPFGTIWEAIYLAQHVTDELDRIDLHFLTACRCARYHAHRNWWDPLVKDVGMCEACFWKIETMVMCRIIPPKFSVYPS